MDPWVVTPAERAKHDQQFANLGPSPAGLVTGDQAKGFLLQSHLPPAVLGKIWGLADHNADGKMNRDEFSVACKLITNKLKGFEVPATLPPALRALLSPASGTPPPAGIVSPPQMTPAGLGQPLIPGVGMSQPLVPSAGLGQPLVPAGGLGQPLVPSAGLGQPLAPAGGLGQPLVPAGGLGQPLVPAGGLGQPLVPAGGLGQPLVPAGGGLPGQMGVTAPLVATGPVAVQSAAPVAAAAPLAARSRSDSVASQDSTQSGAAAGDWAVPQASRLKYTQTFNQHDRTKSGYLSGPQARNILVQSGLPNNVLAQIWSLCDVDQDGRLSCDEFVLALHLCERTRLGDKLSNTLPPELVPPSFRRVARSRTISTGSQPGDAEPVLSPSQQASFEDRRRENYNKGQAELERRRKVLEDQQRREQEERARKEREEQERLERARLEQEQRRREELERQLERQRELEQQQQEARRRELETREAARRELERKRQEEWENQKRQELESQRQRQQETVLRLKAQNTQLMVQLSSASDRVKELTQNISDTRAGVTDVKSTIDGMRATRDTHMAQLTALKAQLREQNNRLLQVNQERAKLEARNKLNDANNPVQAGLESVAMNYDSKRHIIEQLRRRLEAAQDQCSEKESELEGRLHDLKEAKDVLNSLVASCQEVNTQLELKRQAVLQRRQGQRTPDAAPAPATTGASWATSPPAQQQQQQQQGWAADFGAPAWSSSAQPAASSGADFGSSAWAPAATDWSAPWDSNKSAGGGGGGGGGGAADPWGEAATGTPAASGDGPRKVPYTALYAFEGRSADEVSFQPGDTVLINLDANPEPSWLEGEVNGRVGWLPESYVAPADASVGVAADGSSAVNGTSSAAQSEQEPPAAEQPPAADGAATEPVSAAPQQTASPAVTSGERYVALYTYESSEPGDLVFQQGDTILVTEKHGEWWTGTLGAATGIFPSNYVQLLEEQPEPEPPAATPQPSEPTTEQSQPADRQKRKGEVAVAIAPYEATSSEQLSLCRGQLVMVRKKSETGWWEGEIQMRGKQRQLGWFPASFVKLKTSRRMSIPDEAEPPMPDAQCPGDAPAPDPGAPKERVVAQFPYSAQNDDELTFQADDVITVVNKDDTAWWKGELHGVVGLFPSNYVAPQYDDGAATTYDRQHSYGYDPPADGYDPPADGYGPAADGYGPAADWSGGAGRQPPPDGVWEDSWSSSEEGAAPYEEAPAVGPPVTTEQDRQRQEAIAELIDSERSYLASMALVTEVFRRPLAAAGLLTREESHALFVNWSDLVKTSRKLVVSLKVRRKMSAGGVIQLIGDIMCENLPHMECYMRFCSCQLRAATLLQKKVQHPRFDDAVRRCQSDPRAGGMPLSSFLLKPTQRVTKYPLLIKQILKHTAVDHPDRANLEEALNRAEELCRQLNEGVREQQNTDRLEWMQEHVDCSELPERIVFNSMTNSAGPRRLLHFGLLKKTKSGREVVVFLFNDFVLLTTPSRPLGNVSQLEFDRNLSNLRFKLYKKPLFLAELEVSVPPESPDALLLTGAGLVVSLTAGGGVARDLWLRQLRAAQESYRALERTQLQRQHSREAKFAACGRLLVVIMSANRLVAASADGKSDPYCELTMGSQVQRTPVVEGTLNPRWNHSMQFLVKDVRDDVLCISVFDRDYFSPNEFLGRTELRVADVHGDNQRYRGPIIKRLPLHEVKRGEVDLKLDLQIFDQPQ
ncbi:intersectin-1-like isoform X3 [Amphibalanus amphitrite]|uniref:intersectin-1-like isoform X3 n=1 Tax=Amphibalanus amphitrite TaxID=1232801 RepID=UPI001C92B4B2|nr:intersectin-1-like isoform X3 [Amphibalanus amphitrite]